MPMLVHLDVMLAKRKLKSKDLALYVGITEQNLSLLKSGKVKGIRFSTLEKICERLACQQGELIEWLPAVNPAAASTQADRQELL